MLSLVYIDPYKYSRLTKWLSIINSSFLVLISDGLFIFTDFTLTLSQQYAKYYTGWYIIILIIAMSGVNIGVLGYVYIKRIVQKVRRRYFEYKFRNYAHESMLSATSQIKLLGY